eukprot:GHUV01039868.1.p1 GENE.GHUV01039868.1~~GHUV01039868.1.p1  ORF type:complete len:122 (+),score=17.00 GHUV01039868.1:793-1158(+)
MFFQKTASHFADLKRRYGNPIIALNLLKSKERRLREVLLRREYAAAVALLNAAAPTDQQIIYIPWGGCGNFQYAICVCTRCCTRPDHVSVLPGVLCSCSGMWCMSFVQSLRGIPAGVACVW